jgi:hypothetical protein
MHHFHRLQADKHNIIEKRNQGDNFRLRAATEKQQSHSDFRSRTATIYEVNEGRWMEEMRGRIGEEKRKYLRLVGGVQDQDDRAIQAGCGDSSAVSIG